ncbi:aspartate--ammonia ligase [Peribacillus sp. FSL H8-0477]|uniref:aspartate--ammonia ligase n=1 Tax=Peribacillus sp. FSL H8-0477 TaxID=2921388 RepID=UPI0030FC143C
MTKTLTLPNAYQPLLDVKHTEICIKVIKELFEEEFSEALNLMEVSAPLLLLEGTGLNDNLNGVERFITFDALDIEPSHIQLVQSLAKWKRMALHTYNFMIGEGLYTNMKAIRRDEVLDNLHSIYVDQWDWEKVITKEQRNLTTLRTEVLKIYEAMKAVENYLYKFNPLLIPILPEHIHFVTTFELEEMYPALSPKQREDAITKKHGAVFVMQIGGELKSGEKHDGRSPDYDDWNLNGDIVFWNPLLQSSFEVSSMGIRVDEKTMLEQLKVANNEDRKELHYHKSLLNGELPYTIGGGIGQSRLCMFLLKKAHIGEVQASVWNEKVLKECKDNNIQLL